MGQRSAAAIGLGTTLLLGLLAAVGPISTDIYLPAFTRIDHAFGRAGAAQITLAAWFAGLACGQLVQGVLADRLGRRAPLLVSTLIYSGASVGCALAPGLVSFSAFRFIAASSASASMVIPRAMIRDVAEGIAAATLLSRLTLVIGVVPILAPAAGGLLLTFLSWRDLFWAAAAYGVVCSLLVWRFLPDTLPPGRRLRRNLATMALRFVRIGREAVFARNAAVAGCGFAALFAYISGSASVYTGHFHLTPAQYGVVFGINAVGFIGASQIAPRLAARRGIDPVLRLGTRLMFCSYLLAAIAAFTGWFGLAGIAVPVFFGQAGWGLMAPLTVVNALARHRAHAGSASALFGTLQFTLGALAGALVGFTANGTPAPMGTLMLVFAALAFAAEQGRRPIGVRIFRRRRF